MNYDELVTLTTDVGCLLLANGAEIYRVEESMLRIFALTGYILVKYLQYLPV